MKAKKIKAGLYEYKGYRIEKELYVDDSWVIRMWAKTWVGTVNSYTHEFAWVNTNEYAKTLKGAKKTIDYLFA
jgi:hypothetical protein